MHPGNRDELRQLFFTSWRKYQEKNLMEPLDIQIIEIVLQHPEYHALLNDPEQYQAKDFDETNPFLHMSLHLALREQLQTNRPYGIKDLYNTLCQKFSDNITAEHHMIECLAHTLWDAQRNRVMPDEQKYLANLKKLL